MKNFNEKEFRVQLSSIVEVSLNLSAINAEKQASKFMGVVLNKTESEALEAELKPLEESMEAFAKSLNCTTSFLNEKLIFEDHIDIMEVAKRGMARKGVIM